MYFPIFDLWLPNCLRYALSPLANIIVLKNFNNYPKFCNNILSLIVGSREEDDCICLNICCKDIFVFHSALHDCHSKCIWKSLNN